MRQSRQVQQPRQKSSRARVSHLHKYLDHTSTHHLHPSKPIKKESEKELQGAVVCIKHLRNLQQQHNLSVQASWGGDGKLIVVLLEDLKP